MPARLLSLELVAVGPFARKAVDLGGDLVGVFGPNGSGKSTLLSAALYALTGDLGRLGRGGEAVCDRRTPGEAPLVRLTVSPTGDPGDVAVVTRWLPDGKARGRRRLVRGDRCLTSEADVAAEVSGWLGMPPDAVGSFVFVAQGRTADVVDDRPARRAELLQRLFAVSDAEAARDSLLLAVGRLPAPADAATAAEARARAAELAAQVAATEGRLAALPDYPADVVAAATAVAAARRRRETLLPSAHEARARVDRLEAAASGPLPPEPPDPVPLAEARAAWAAYRNRVRERDEFLAEAARAEARAAARPEPPAVPDPPATPDESDARRAGVLAAILACGVGSECPVCGSTVSDPSDRATAARSEYDALTAARAAYDRAVADRARALEARDRYDRAVRADLQDAEVARARAADPPEPPACPEPDPGAAAAARLAADAYAAARSRRDAARAELPAARDHLAAVLSRLPPEADPDDLAAADRVLTDSAAAAARRFQLEGELAASRRALAAYESVVRAARSAEEAARGTAADRALLEAAAAVLHRDAAPAGVVRARLAELTGEVNANLRSLRAGFEVEMDGGGELTPVRGGRRVPRLSGGQACVLALAWRLALSPGLLCLDEPTYGLDAERIDALRDALAAWRGSGAGGQLVVVTHDPRLRGVFDTVVELP